MEARVISLSGVPPGNSINTRGTTVGNTGGRCPRCPAGEPPRVPGLPSTDLCWLAPRSLPPRPAPHPPGRCYALQRVPQLWHPAPRSLSGGQAGSPPSSPAARSPQEPRVSEQPLGTQPRPRRRPDGCAEGDGRSGFVLPSPGLLSPGSHPGRTVPPWLPQSVTAVPADDISARLRGS